MLKTWATKKKPRKLHQPQAPTTPRVTRSRLGMSGPMSRPVRTTVTFLNSKILKLLLDFSLRVILKKFLIFAHFQPPIFIKMIVIKTNGVYCLKVCLNYWKLNYLSNMSWKLLKTRTITLLFSFISPTGLSFTDNLPAKNVLRIIDKRICMRRIFTLGFVCHCLTHHSFEKAV